MKIEAKLYTKRFIITAFGCLLLLLGMLLRFFPQWFNLEKSRNLVPFLGLVLPLTGGSFALVGIVLLVREFRKQALNRRVHTGGQAVSAHYLGSEFVAEYLGRPLYLVRCLLPATKDTPHRIVHSELLCQDVSAKMPAQVPVYYAKQSNGTTAYYVAVAEALQSGV